MRVRIPLLIVFLLTVFAAKSQYYYKDIVLTRQNQANWKLFHDRKVKEADIQSIDANNEPTARVQLYPNFFIRLRHHHHVHQICKYASILADRRL